MRNTNLKNKIADILNAVEDTLAKVFWMAMTVDDRAEDHRRDAQRAVGASETEIGSNDGRG